MCGNVYEVFMGKPIWTIYEYSIRMSATAVRRGRTHHIRDICNAKCGRNGGWMYGVWIHVYAYVGLNGNLICAIKRNTRRETNKGDARIWHHTILKVTFMRNLRSNECVKCLDSVLCVCGPAWSFLYYRRFTNTHTIKTHDTFYLSAGITSPTHATPSPHLPATKKPKALFAHSRNVYVPDANAKHAIHLQRRTYDGCNTSRTLAAMPRAKNAANINGTLYIGIDIYANPFEFMKQVQIMFPPFAFIAFVLSIYSYAVCRDPSPSYDLSSGVWWVKCNIKPKLLAGFSCF